MNLQATKKITEATYAYCNDCDDFLGSPYWSLSKSVGLHKRGCPTHKVTLYKLSDELTGIRLV